MKKQAAVKNSSAASTAGAVGLAARDVLAESRPANRRNVPGSACNGTGPHASHRSGKENVITTSTEDHKPGSSKMPEQEAAAAIGSNAVDLNDAAAGSSSGVHKHGQYIHKQTAVMHSGQQGNAADSSQRGTVPRQQAPPMSIAQLTAGRTAAESIKSHALSSSDTLSSDCDQGSINSFDVDCSEFISEDETDSSECKNQPNKRNSKTVPAVNDAQRNIRSFAITTISSVLSEDEDSNNDDHEAANVDPPAAMSAERQPISFAITITDTLWDDDDDNSSVPRNTDDATQTAMPAAVSAERQPISFAITINDTLWDDDDDNSSVPRNTDDATQTAMPAAVSAQQGIRSFTISVTEDGGNEDGSVVQPADDDDSITVPTADVAAAGNTFAYDTITEAGVQADSVGSGIDNTSDDNNSGDNTSNAPISDENTSDDSNSDAPVSNDSTSDDSNSNAPISDDSTSNDSTSDVNTSDDNISIAPIFTDSTFMALLASQQSTPSSADTYMLPHLMEHVREELKSVWWGRLLLDGCWIAMDLYASLNGC
eukprot:jgi/Chrzof1/14920/Cz09g20210.t1